MEPSFIKTGMMSNEANNEIRKKIQGLIPLRQKLQASLAVTRKNAMNWHVSAIKPKPLYISMLKILFRFNSKLESMIMRRIVDMSR